MGEKLCNLQGGVQQIVNIVYPVGISIICDHNPQNDYPWQKWTQDFKDRFPLGAGDAYKAGATGGEATHTLSVNEMPSHHHTHGEYITDGDYGYVPAGSHIGSLVHAATQNDSRGGVITDRQQTQADTGFIGYTGGSQPHNNMPPYQAVSYWTRTA